MAKKTRETTWVKCSSCGNEGREHRVLCERVVKWADDEDGPVYSVDYHRFVQCMGCKKYKYVVSTSDCLHDGAEEEVINIYPEVKDGSSCREPRLGSDDYFDSDYETLVPEVVKKMYIETISAFNAGSLTLAGAGLRAIVEAICLDKQIQGRNLLLRIDGLVTQGFLAKKQADHLHEARYLGNDAVHKLTTPSKEDIENGLEIVEGLINTIYILPSKADRLKKKREAKKPSPPKK